MKEINYLKRLIKIINQIYKENQKQLNKQSKFIQKYIFSKQAEQRD